MQLVRLDRVAERMDVTRRWLLEWLRKHPCDQNGTPFYRSAGRIKLFTETDIARLEAALPRPEAPRCPSNSSRRAPAIRTGRSAAATSMSNDYIALRELLRSASPNRRSGSSSGTSKVEPLPRKRGRPLPVLP